MKAEKLRFGEKSWKLGGRVAALETGLFPSVGEQITEEANSFAESKLGARGKVGR